ncbi:hypothetical protein [Sulfurimonas sp.]
MILTPEILTIYLLNFLFLLFSLVAFYYSIKIVKYYDRDATSTLQYNLEKQSYLVATIVKFIFYIKIPLFVFFIFTLDKISVILPGAMCAAGVVNATDYGVYLIFLKLLNLYLFAYWLVLNSEDMHSPKQPYIKLKFKIFIGAFLLLVLEIFLETLMFGSIDVKSLVDCCGAIFSTTNATYLSQMIGASPKILLTLFYTNFLLLVFFYITKNRHIYSILNLFFIIISLVTLISFFGTYIYELPTHHCPFCLLQKEYHYIGYVLYIFLFVGTFNGLVIGIIEFSKNEEKKKYKISMLFNTLYLLGVSYYPAAYYMKNGVWL